MQAERLERARCKYLPADGGAGGVAEGNVVVGGGKGAGKGAGRRRVEKGEEAEEENKKEEMEVLPSGLTPLQDEWRLLMRGPHSVDVDPLHTQEMLRLPAAAPAKGSKAAANQGE